MLFLDMQKYYKIIHEQTILHLENIARFRMCLLSKKYTNDGRNLIIMSPSPIAAAAVHRIGSGTDYRRIANMSAKSRNIFSNLIHSSFEF